MLNLENVKSLLGEAHVLSVYLPVDNALPENQADTPAWRIELKNALRRIEENLPEDAATWPDIRERADAFFADYKPGSKGLAAFFDETDAQVYPLPVRVDADVSFGAPVIAPLVWVIDEYEPYLVLMVDREEAAFYFNYLGSTAFETAMEIDLDDYDFAQKSLVPSASAIAGGHKLTQGINRDAFEAMIEEHHARFFRDVAAQTEQIASEKDLHRIILAGNDQTAHEIHRMLSEYWREKVVNVLNIPKRTKVAEIFENIYPIAVDYERSQEMDTVNEVIDFAKAGGRGALGKKAVEQAMEMQQIEMLLLSWPAHDPEYANALVRQMLMLNGEVELISGAAAAKLNREADGIAARLYYSI